jgi:hypothetical protein
MRRFSVCGCAAVRGGKELIGVAGARGLARARRGVLMWRAPAAGRRNTVVVV